MSQSSSELETAGRRLPGDLDKAALMDRIIRVDHAGEFGAVQIYKGQLAVLGKSASAETIRHMADQERRHLEKFESLVVERGVRPTALQPLWTVAGFALGAVTALMGEKAAMACTAAVEEVIDQHYTKQAQELGPDEAPLKAVIEEFRAEEVQHHDTAIARGAEQAPAYPLLSGLIKAGSRAAIWLSERV